jgi:hypothetical protein
MEVEPFASDCTNTELTFVHSGIKLDLVLQSNEELPHYAVANE